MLKRSWSILWFANNTLTATAVLLLLCLTSASCGYQLSGQTDHQGRIFSPILKQVAIQNLKLYDTMRATISNHLRRYGIQTVNSTLAVPKIVIEVNDLKEPRAVVGDFARTREVLLSLRVVFSVIYQDSYLIKSRPIQLQSTYLYNINDPNRNQNERARVLQRIYQRLAEHIVNHLATIRKNTKPLKERKDNE